MKKGSGNSLRVEVTCEAIYVYTTDANPSGRFISALNAISVENLVTALRNKTILDVAIVVSREFLIKKGERILIKTVEFTGDEKVKNGKL